MLGSNHRWLRGLVVVLLCPPGGVGAQPVWHPVGVPMKSVMGRLSPCETTCREGTPHHVIDLGAKGPVAAWLEWTEAAAELNLTAWRNGTLLASAAPIGSAIRFLHVDPGRPGPLEFRVTHGRGPDSVTYRLHVWQGERLRWSPAADGSPSVEVGQGVLIVEDDGEPMRVRIAAIAPSRLVTVYNGQSREIPTTRVTRIQRGDSLRNGALIGFLAGAGFALNRLGDCEMNCYSGFVPVLGGIGTGIGILVDAARRNTTLHVVSKEKSGALDRTNAQ